MTEINKLTENIQRRLVVAERGLAAIGWSIVDLDVDATTGTGRAEFRSSSGRVVRVVARDDGAYYERDQERTVQRPAREIPLSGHPKRRGAPVTEIIRDFLGRSVARSFPDAMRMAVNYMASNMPAAVSDAQRSDSMVRTVRFMLVAAVTREPQPRRCAEVTPMTEEWAAIDAKVCLGNGWDPYIPSVTAGGDCHVRRFVATSGTIVEGRGVHREGTYQRGPLVGEPP